MMRGAGSENGDVLLPNQRAMYPNAIIPIPNPFAVHMYSFYPESNRMPDDIYNANNYTANRINTARLTAES